MATDFNEQIERIRAKATVLVEKYLRLQEAYESLRAENTELKGRVEAQNKELEQLRMQVEYLSIASTVKMSGEDIDSTRAMVADLVRELDRCIADLND